MFLSDNFIDVSGRPRQDIFVGFISFSSPYKTKVIKAFDNKFPDLIRSRAKGTKLDGKKLLQIVTFLSDNRVKMYAVQFSKKDWQECRADLREESYLNDRIYAILYYKLLKKFCHRGKTDAEYTITVCQESNVNMINVLNTCRRLCKGGRINVDFNKSIVKHSPNLKFADYVAAAFRKVNKRDLDEIKNYTIVNNKLQPKEVNKAFRLYKKGH